MLLEQESQGSGWSLPFSIPSWSMCPCPSSATLPQTTVARADQFRLFQPVQAWLFLSAFHRLVTWLFIGAVVSGWWLQGCIGSLQPNGSTWQSVCHLERHSEKHSGCQWCSACVCVAVHAPVLVLGASGARLAGDSGRAAVLMMSTGNAGTA